MWFHDSTPELLQAGNDDVNWLMARARFEPTAISLQNDLGRKLQSECTFQTRCEFQ